MAPKNTTSESSGLDYGGSSRQEGGYSQTKNRGITGLFNLGNTCYMNAVLQCLCSTTPLVEYFISGSYHTAIVRGRGELANNFAHLMENMWFGDYNYISPEAFQLAVSKLHPPFGRKIQHDAQELLIYVLNGLHEELGKECLQSFFQQDTLTWGNKMHCSFCETKQDTSVKSSIYSAPKILILHLKRFEFEGQYKRKLRTDVTFPINNLDLSPFLSPSLQRCPRYHLYAVVNHFGDLDWGHYTAYCKSPVTQRWYTFDDTRFFNIPQSTVQTSNAYILFYTCQPFNAPTSPPPL